MNDREHPRELPVLAERVDRLHDARSRHERAEDREEERDDDERHVPDLQHAAPLLHHHGVQEGRGREPRQQAGVLDRIPAPVAAPAELLVRPQRAERQADRQEQPRDHRPAAHRAQPRVVELAAERARQCRTRTESSSRRSRGTASADGSPCRSSAAAGSGPAPAAGALVRNVSNGLLWITIRKRKNISTTAIDGDDPRDQQPVALAVDVTTATLPKIASSVDPEHDRAVEPAPVGRELVEERLRRRPSSAGRT